MPNTLNRGVFGLKTQGPRSGRAYSAHMASLIGFGAWKDYEKEEEMTSEKEGKGGEELVPGEKKMEVGACRVTMVDSVSVCRLTVKFVAYFVLEDLPVKVLFVLFRCVSNIVR